MGGLFRAPKPIVIPAVAPARQAESVTADTARADAAAEQAADGARRASAARARAGLPGTIATSERGVLDPRPGWAVRKTLLGE